MSEESHEPGWYPDPHGRHELRWFDGRTWTEHVSSKGRQTVDPAVDGVSDVGPGHRSPDVIDLTAVERERPAVEALAPGTIEGEPVLVVNQEAKVVDATSEFAIYDRTGTQLGAVRRMALGRAMKLLRLPARVDHYVAHRYQIIDMAGHVLWAVTQPTKVVKARMLVSDGAGRDVGEVVQDGMFGRVRFGMHARGERVGSIDVERWEEWDFPVLDDHGALVARITKDWEGPGRRLFPNDDNYALEVLRPLDDPLRSLVVASALTVGTALSPDVHSST